VVFMATGKLSTDDSPFELVMVPRHENSNLRAQKGVFTNIVKANEFLVVHGRWPSMNEVNGDCQLQRARLPSRCADDLLRVLFHHDVTRHSLLPSLDNAARAQSYVTNLFRA
jgi:hypothetical protein